jgi:hypothetical protein
VSDIRNDVDESSEERWALVKCALQRIAADHELLPSGYRKKLPRHEAINIAREVCHALGWRYGPHELYKDDRQRRDARPTSHHGGGLPVDPNCS